MALSVIFLIVGMLTLQVGFISQNWSKAVTGLKNDWAIRKLSDAAEQERGDEPSQFNGLQAVPLLRADILRFFEQSLDPVLPTPLISDNERLNLLQPTDLLNDPLDRISSEFKVDPRLMARTQFWFKIYTLFDSHDHVIHHLRYPWIVFKVVNTRSMIENGKGPLWLRRQTAQRFVDSEKLRIAKSLKNLSRLKNLDKLSDEEKEFLGKIRSLKQKSLSQQLRFAAQNVRSQLGQKDFFLSGLRNSGKYLPYMEEEFLSLGLPTELTRLPFVESSFNESARSKVGASGIWQIMPRTGKAYLVLNSHIDERNSPLKATRAAGRLLRGYKKGLAEKWPLAITAYNHGIGNIKKSMEKAGSSDIALIIERYHGGSFKFASSNFYTCFLAALYAEKYHDILFPTVSKHRLLERQVLTLQATTSISRLAQLTKLPLKTLRLYNRDLEDAIDKRRGVLPKGYQLHVPLNIEAEEAYRAADRGSATKLANPGSEKTRSL